MLEERFPLNQASEGVLATPDADLHAHAIRFSFAPIWRFRVPVGIQILVYPGDKFYLHIRDGSVTPLEWHDEQEVRISFWNSVQREMRIAYQGFYREVKEATDIDRMARYQIAETHIIPGGGWVFIEGLATRSPHTIRTAVSHFSLNTRRIRERI